LDGVQDQPSRSLEQATRILASDDCSDDAAVVARWALGRALQELGQPGRAAEELATAAAGADSLGDADTWAQIEMSRSWAAMAAGDSDGALEALERADSVLTGAAGARVQMQRGLLLFQLGQLDGAMESLSTALPVLRQADDRVAVARLLVNRSAVATAMGRWEVARTDLVEATDVARAEGLGLVVAGAEHNLGFLCGRQGDIPRALHHFANAAESYAALDSPGRLMSVLGVDRCEVLLGAGLTSEARHEAATAVAGFESTGSVADADEARLLLARAELAAGDADSSRATASRAEAGFVATGRSAWAALAAYTALVAEVAATEDRTLPPSDLPDRVQAILHRLEASGWTTEAAHARTFLGRTALAVGRTDLARAALAGRRIPRSAGAALRVQTWHGRALLRSASGDPAGAARAVRQGLRVVDGHRHTLGATELRAGAATLGTELARLGLRLALDTGHPARVLAAAELHRAAALRTPPVRPPDDSGLRAALADLRTAEADHRTATVSGGDRRGTERLLVAAERRVREITRQRPGEEESAFTAPTVAELRRALGGRTLVAYVVIDRHLHAVTVGPRETRLVDLGDAAAAEAERNHLLSGLRRGLRTLLRSERDGQRVAEVIESSTARLDELLVGPLGLSGGSPADLVVVPTAFGFAVPWGSLPSLRSRGVTIAPSAAMWLRARSRSSSRRLPPLLVAGPEVDGAAAELNAIASVWPGARRLDGPDASVDAVLDGFGTADLAHVSAHGRFRADSPLFSSLTLADGLLTVYDLEGLSQVPHTVILPACSAAAVDVRAGDELLGTASALLATGVTSVVAPVVAIPDSTAASFTVGLHERLARGMPVARATAESAADLRSDGDPLSVLTATSFVCIGGDDRAGEPGGPDPVSGRSRG